MANPLPTNPAQLRTMGDAIADGLHDLEAIIGVLQHTEVKVRANVADSTAKQLAFAESFSARQGLTQAQTTADNNGRVFIGQTKNVLAATLGGQWSQVWEPTGFPNQSLAIPTTLDERLSLLGSLQAFLVANPTLENAPLNVTAARAGILFNALSDARHDINANLADGAQKKLERNNADTALRVRIRGVIDEIDSLIDDDDPRWYQFGLVPPAYSDAPDAPENLILTAGGSPGEVLVDWSDSARAVSYRVYKKIVGVDADFTLIASPADSDATLAGLPSGQTVQVKVVAVGAAPQNLTSPDSETKQIVVP